MMERGLYKVGLSVMIVLIHFGLALSQPLGQKKLMLVLGSDNLETLKERVQVAYTLFNSKEGFDKIIVSGGCGAHGSSLCEASEMMRQLVKLGVPESLIIKEEKSKTTLQNYLFSRFLTDERGQQIIEKGDRLYVVSNHWHAIAVASRFRTYDQVDAHYFISGKLIPKETDPVDYVGIYHGYNDQDELLRKMLENNIVAAEYNDNSKITLYQNQLGTTFVYSNRLLARADGEFWKGFPDTWDGKIDDICYDRRTQSFNIVRKDMLYKFTNEGKYVKSLPLSTLIEGLPEAWLERGLDAITFSEERVYVFYEKMIWIGLRKGSKFFEEHLFSVVNYIKGWPFSWGQGDLDAAVYMPSRRVLKLFRAKENIEFSLEKGKVIVDPQATKTVLGTID